MSGTGWTGWSLEAWGGKTPLSSRLFAGIHQGTCAPITPPPILLC
jgi:hypothetical protein